MGGATWDRLHRRPTSLSAPPPVDASIFNSPDTLRQQVCLDRLSLALRASDGTGRRIYEEAKGREGGAARHLVGRSMQPKALKS